jgi:hypothetical protein
MCWLTILLLSESKQQMLRALRIIDVVWVLGFQ